MSTVENILERVSKLRSEVRSRVEERFPKLKEVLGETNILGRIRSGRPILGELKIREKLEEVRAKGLVPLLRERVESRVGKLGLIGGEHRRPAGTRKVYPQRKPVTKYVERKKGRIL
ncbi:hypothetical protein J7K27_02435 [Candidatus Bathyarchaeota archaeon]|nr:hypothetical protein [Candidatus Bathyarchaeota archaeon]